MARCKSAYLFAGTWHTRCVKEADPVHTRHYGPGRMPSETPVRWTEANVTYQSDRAGFEAWEVPGP